MKRTAYLAECTVNYVHRWTTRVEGGGTGGRIPDKPRRRLLDAAKAGLVDVTPADFEQGWESGEATK
ncbi:hypothetical protein ACEUZ9_002193 [Paracoccus litorisediminis]|uniref:hypothetical protein n=1 Tax=Paracoccus litorisediminis TaxID=2006130 RepID=UPI00372F4D79